MVCELKGLGFALRAVMSVVGFGVVSLLVVVGGGVVVLSPGFHQLPEMNSWQSRLKESLKYPDLASLRYDQPVLSHV